jgi:hypothetical protein
LKLWFFRKAETTQQQFREMIKQQIADNNPRRLKGALDDPGNLPAPLQLCQQLMEDIKHFKSQVVLVKILCNRSLRKRHWQEISALLECDIYPDAGASLKKMLKLREFTPELIQYVNLIFFTNTNIKFKFHAGNAKLSVLEQQKKWHFK